MDLYNKLAEKIIEEQERIIGPVAIDQARKVPGVSVNWASHEVKIEGNKKDALEHLVGKYEDLFGKVAVEVCKDALKGLDVPRDQLPTVLQ